MFELLVGVHPGVHACHPDMGLVDHEVFGLFDPGLFELERRRRVPIDPVENLI